MGNWRAGLGCLMILVVTLYLVVMAPILANRREDEASADQLATPTAAREVVLRYYVWSNVPNAHARISYRTPEGTTDEVPDYQGPWDKVLPFTAGLTASLSAQAGASAGQTDTITCEIQVDGQPWKQETATGPGSTVTCAGVVGP